MHEVSQPRTFGGISVNVDDRVGGDNTFFAHVGDRNPFFKQTSDCLLSLYYPVAPFFRSDIYFRIFGEALRYGVPSSENKTIDIVILESLNFLNIFGSLNFSIQFL